MEYIDISPVISSKIAHYPGDVPFQRTIGKSFEKGDNYALSSITTSVHVGAHADAPSHYHRDGISIDQVRLTRYMGSCQVVAVTGSSQGRIESTHIGGLEKITAKRVLFKTNSFSDPNRWTNDFLSLAPQFVNELWARGVILVGIDTPSVDPATDPQLESHQAIFSNQMSILEGLDLSKAPEGRYTLIALPLRILDGDASPVRAILVMGENHLGD